MRKNFRRNRNLSGVRTVSTDRRYQTVLGLGLIYNFQTKYVRAHVKMDFIPGAQMTIGSVQMGKSDEI